MSDMSGVSDVNIVRALGWLRRTQTTYGLKSAIVLTKKFVIYVKMQNAWVLIKNVKFAGAKGKLCK
jgi:hypothetical protein